jgi:hypothetical protein
VADEVLMEGRKGGEGGRVSKISAEERKRKICNARGGGKGKRNRKRAKTERGALHEYITTYPQQLDLAEDALGID